MDPARVRRLVDAAALAQARLEARIVAQVRAAFLAFDGWYSDALVAEVAAQVAAQVAGGVRLSGQLTDAYLARVASEIVEATVRPAGFVPPASGSFRQGVTLRDVYGRVAREFRYQASLGLPASAAQERAVTRAGNMAQVDLQLARREQAHRFMVVNRTDGYRRVVHPELSRDGSCGLCVVASDRLYKRGDLMPLHDGCRCAVLPVINGVDPGRALNDEDLSRVYAAAGGTNEGRKLRRVRVAVHHHGELGPILADARHDWRGPADVAAA